MIIKIIETDNVEETYELLRSTLSAFLIHHKTILGEGWKGVRIISKDARGGVVFLDIKPKQ